jgi:GT2 family glycosyltransferase
MAIDISIIIVNYNTKQLLENCITSIIENTKQIHYEIIVSDNNSTDGSLTMVKTKFPNVHLINNNNNLGFSRANNIAYKRSKGENLLFLNSDTLVLDGSLKKMNEYLKAHPEVGIVGPKIFNSKGQPTRSYMRFLDLRKLFLGSEILKHFIDVEKYRIHHSEYDYDSIKKVPWISGACMMTRRKVFQQAGLFDERYFLYLEDMDLCLQVTKLGYAIVYFPQAEIIHYFGGSSENNHHKLSLIHKDSMIHYFKKNFSCFHYLIAKLYITYFR